MEKQTQKPQLPQNAVSSSDGVTHELKILEKYALLYLTNKKNWEIRKNDRNFKEGDIIHFTILNNETKEPMNTIGYWRRINYVFQDEKYGLKKGYCILSIY